MAKNSSAKKMNVLHVTKWYPNAFDVQNGVFIQKHILCTRTFADVKVLAWLPGKEKTHIVESVEDKLAITRHYFKPKTPISYKRHAFREYIRSHCNADNLPNLIHLHIFSPDFILILNWAKKKKIPVVISEHWSGYARGIFQQMPFWKKWAYRKLGSVQRILPVSDYLEKNMINCGIMGNYTVVPNVVEQNKFRPQKQENFTYLVVADLVDAIKNVSGIIAAFTQFAAEDKSAQLHVIGGGPDEKFIENLIEESTAKERIKWWGRQNNDFVLRHLPACHVLINNSRFETFGVTILEAHAAGIPVISTLCGGPNEWLEEADFTIPVDDKKALFQAMKAAFATKNEKPIFTLHKNGFPEIVSKKLQNVYTSALSDSQ